MAFESFMDVCDIDVIAEVIAFLSKKANFKFLFENYLLLDLADKRDLNEIV